jgi:uncharacterized membrane protein
MLIRQLPRSVVFLGGTFVAVLYVVWLGLLNEGFESVRFLFYPGVETWLQIGLLATFAVLVALLWVGKLTIAPSSSENSSLLMVATFSGGLVFAGLVLLLIGNGEGTTRKFYTYVVAPRAVMFWLAAAVLATLKTSRRRVNGMSPNNPLDRSRPR